ncbi:MAG: inositol monophosphatase family protein [Deltaproteobacteria bacterium]|jgi:inositol-phosphate phosphatase / L-galactose 1-phosphate phosphatase / histidinol-phosphatase|nr:inositol monophosphatase family protein [Deltaproteobacteria bacterium]
MKETHIKAFAESAELMAIAAGKYIRENMQQSFNTEFKGDGSPVTDIDKGTEDCIREIITEKYPDHGILGEEREDVRADAEFKWLIDPIDGTLPFITGIPVFGTLLALVHGDTPIIGVIDMPMTGDRWIGRRGLETLKNGNPVHTRPCADLASAYMSTSNPDFYSEEELSYLNNMRAATKLAVYGGSCMAYAQLASGRIDVGMDVQFDIHDYIPLVPVIQGAGGMITDWNGNPLNCESADKFVAAGDKCVHEQAISILNS